MSGTGSSRDKLRGVRWAIEAGQGPPPRVEHAGLGDVFHIEIAREFGLGINVDPDRFKAGRHDRGDFGVGKQVGVVGLVPVCLEDREHWFATRAGCIEGGREIWVPGNASGCHMGRDCKP